MKIIVLGAYGYTGKLVCQELMKSQVEFAIGGRNLSKLEALNLNKELEILEMTNGDDIKRIVARFDIFINCIGPFAESADQLLSWISTTRKIYLDLSGETVFVQNSRTKYHEDAFENRATIIHGCAFESVLADLLAHQLVGDLDVSSIHSYYLLGKAKPSPGTRLTMKLSKFSNPYFVENGDFVSIKSINQKEVSWKGVGDFVAVPYPLPEICFYNWNFTAKNIGSYLLVDEPDAKFMKNQPKSSQTKDEIIDIFNLRRPKGPNEEQRENQAFTLIVEIIDSKGNIKNTILKGQDMYLLTAKIIDYFINEILNSKTKFGVISPVDFLGKESDLIEKLFD